MMPQHEVLVIGAGLRRAWCRDSAAQSRDRGFRILDPRDTNSSFEPQIVHKRQRRLTGIDEIVLSLMAKRLTTGEIVAHFVDVYGPR